jgi:glycine cleavage system regulatory protein
VCPFRVTDLELSVMSDDSSAADQRDSLAVRFMVDAEASPGLLPRLLQPFARRDLTPDRMWSHRNAESLHVEIALHAMPAEMVHLVEGNLRQVVGVQRVTQVRPTELLRAA